MDELHELAKVALRCLMGGDRYVMSTEDAVGEAGLAADLAVALHDRLEQARAERAARRPPAELGRQAGGSEFGARP